MNGKVVAALLGIAVLSGCASSKTSPERHAYYFVSHKTNFTGGNFTSSVSQNYRLNVPQFRELYERGKPIALQDAHCLRLTSTPKAFAIN